MVHCLQRRIYEARTSSSSNRPSYGKSPYFKSIVKSSLLFSMKKQPFWVVLGKPHFQFQGSLQRRRAALSGVAIMAFWRQSVCPSGVGPSRGGWWLRQQRIIPDFDPKNSGGELCQKKCHSKVHRIAGPTATGASEILPEVKSADCRINSQRKCHARTRNQ